MMNDDDDDGDDDDDDDDDDDEGHVVEAGDLVGAGAAGQEGALGGVKQLLHHKETVTLVRGGQSDNRWGKTVIHNISKSSYGIYLDSIIIIVVNLSPA